MSDSGSTGSDRTQSDDNRPKNPHWPPPGNPRQPPSGPSLPSTTPRTPAAAAHSASASTPTSIAAPTPSAATGAPDRKDAHAAAPPQPPASASPGLAPAETYQIDSSAYSDSDEESLPDDEYNALVAEADAGYTEDEVAVLVSRLKEEGLVNFLRAYLAPQADGTRKSLRKLLLGLGIVPPRPLREPGIANIHLLGFAKVALGRILRRREKLAHLNTVNDAVELLRNAKRIIVLSGAGISTSCGIPDFRSTSGLYAQLQAEGKYDLDDPQQMFDIHYFREHPNVFYSFAKQIYPSNFVPSPCHRWIKLLESRGQLLRNYTQNIDTLESLAGVDKVLQCHGSFKTASCLRCKDRMPGAAIEPYIMSQTIPWCPKCRKERDAEIDAIKAYRAALKKAKNKNRRKSAGWDDDDDDDDDDIPAWSGEPGIIKPDITFFGQALDSEFDECLFKDREEVDLLVIMGTSLKVAPVSEVLSHIPHSVPQIFINMTPVTHVKPDISLLGDADSIVAYLSDQLGWRIPPAPTGGKSGAPLKIPPRDAVWLHGDGDWKHLNMLRSKTAPVADDGDDGDDDDDSDDDDDDDGDSRSRSRSEPDGHPAPHRHAGTHGRVDIDGHGGKSPSGETTESDSDGHDSDVPDVEAQAEHMHITSRSTSASASASNNPSRTSSQSGAPRSRDHLAVPTTPDRRMASGSPASDRPTKRSRVSSMDELPEAYAS